MRHSYTIATKKKVASDARRLGTRGAARKHKIDRKCIGILPENIVNMDETAVFAEHNKNNTLEVRGSTDVPVQSFGLEKVRLTAMFGARADSSKLLLTNKNSWMNSDSFIQYIDYMFPFVMPNKLLLVFASARSHISKAVKTHLHKRKILYAVIPGGLTPFLQPCDYGLFKPLKEHLAALIDEWKENGPHSITARGNVRPPDRSITIGWIKRARAEVSEPSVRRSFRSCFLGENSELSLWRHETYGPAFQSALNGTDEVANAIAELVVDDGGSDMELDDDVDIVFV